MHMANVIYKNRRKLCDDLLYSTRSGASLRDVLSSSQLAKLFQKQGLGITVSQTKAILRDLGLNYNGPAVTMTAFL